MHVAFDGSPLIENPNSPSSLHLIEWLSMLQAAGARITLLYPEGELPPIPAEIGTQALTRRAGAWGQLRFEQRDLPQAAGDLHADLLLVSEGRAPLTSPCPIVAISSLSRSLEPRGWINKLATAAGRAGTRGASALLVPSDAKHEWKDAGRRSYPPFVPQAFKQEALEIREPYVLCYGFGREDVALILSAWTWVDGSLGDEYPLTFLGPEPTLTMEINSIAAELNIEASVRVRGEVSYADLPRLYGAASAFVGTAFAAGGQSLRWALAAGSPVIGLKTPGFESVLGDAAYLVPPGDSRSLGAACLTVLIQERVSLPLREKGAILTSQYLEAHAATTILDLLNEFLRPGMG